MAQKTRKTVEVIETVEVTPTDKVYVGLTVLFVLPNGDVRPAIVLKDWDASETVDLMVLYRGRYDGYAPDNSAQVQDDVKYSADKTPGTWHFVEEK